MALAFDCPNCGAALDPGDAGRPVVECPYCSSTVFVPAEFREGAPAAAEVWRMDGEAWHAIGQLDEIVEIAQLVRQGHKQQAQRLYAQTFGKGDAEASAAIARMASGQPVTLVQAMQSHGFAERAFSQVESIQVQPLQTIKVNPAAAKALAGGVAGISCAGLLGAALIFLLAVVPVVIALATPGGPLAGVWAQLNPFAYARLVESFGGEGSGPGLLDDARLLALDPQGNLFVGSYTDGRVQKFNSAGEFQFLWNIGLERYPQGIAADRSGNVYVIQRGEVFKYSGETGQSLGVLAMPFESSLEAVAATADGSLVLVATSLEWVYYTNDGQMKLPEALSGAAGAQEEDVTDVAVDGVGNVYMLMEWSEGVIKYDPSGRLVGRWGSDGDEPSQFRAAWAIAVDGHGRVYVADIKGIMVFENDGRYIDTIDVEGAAFGLEFDTQGDLWVVTNQERVYRYRIQNSD